jgi:Ca-activated chloride channel family protein
MNHHCPRSRRKARKGGIIVLVSVLIVVLIAMAAFTVDVAYMQMVRTELRASTDAAARAGAEALARTQNKNAAIQAAIDTASRNRVGGRSHRLAASDVVIGSVAPSVTGAWTFSEGGTKLNAVRVNSELSRGSAHGPVGLFFGGAIGTKNFSPSFTATAAQSQNDICLVIDRSHSMCFDMTGVDFSYPDKTKTRSELYRSPPHPALSRWAALRDAMASFFTALESLNPQPRVGLVTWASDLGTASPVVSIDSGLTADKYPIKSFIQNRGTMEMLGATNCAAGIDAGASMLLNDTQRPYANKIMILMTDGMWNQGRNPVDAARDAAAHGVVIHVVTLLPAADQPDMDEVAAVTGGLRFHANDRAALIAAFEQLARSLPSVLTE